jgi:protein-L-isoaspartate(D-aspartate) O-methyltransferase
MPSSAHSPRARKPDASDLERVARTTTRFQKREWAWQRVGWIALGLILVAGSSGIFGGGPLAETSVQNASGELKYQRFVRRHADAEWELRLRRGAASGHADIAFDASFASQFKIVGIQPEPTAASLSGGRWIYRFDVASADDAVVMFHIQPQHVGRHEGRISVNGAAPFTLWQFTYP